MTGSIQKQDIDPDKHAIARRIANGETINDIAKEYGVTRVTIWRWHNEVLARDLPDPVDREAWRAEMIPSLIETMIEAREKGNYRAYGFLMDRFAKLLGLDHSDALNEAMVRIKAAQVQMAVQAVKAAMETAGLTPAQQRTVLDGMVAHVRAIED